MDEEQRKRQLRRKRILERKKRKQRQLIVIIIAVIAAVLLVVLLAQHIIKTSNNAKNQNSVATSEEGNLVEKKIDAMLDSMTLEEKVGQMFLARVPESPQQGDIKTYHLGGYLMFARDFEGETPDSLKEKIEGFQSASSIPMFIASDEEGGEVTRISNVSGLTSSSFQSPQALYAQGGLDAIKSDADSKSQILKNYGINYNLAPVADVATDPNSFIYSRTLGQGADETSKYIRMVVEVMKNDKIGCCLKHFPGYGDNGDSHGAIITDNRDLASFQASDFLPFQAGIDAGADSVLVTHNIVTCLDGTEPSSLSKAVHDYLRNDMHFTGVIITDDFDMEGLSDFIDQNNGAIKSIQAGNDITISSSYSQQIPTVIKAVQDGTISEDTIDASVRRILKMKINLGIITI